MTALGSGSTGAVGAWLYKTLSVFMHVHWHTLGILIAFRNNTTHFKFKQDMFPIQMKHHPKLIWNTSCLNLKVLCSSLKHYLAYIVAMQLWTVHCTCILLYIDYIMSTCTCLVYSQSVSIRPTPLALKPVYQDLKNIKFDIVYFQGSIQSLFYLL